MQKIIMVLKNVTLWKINRKIKLTFSTKCYENKNVIYSLFFCERVLLYFAQIPSDWLKGQRLIQPQLWSHNLQPATALLLLWPWVEACFMGWLQKVVAEFGSQAILGLISDPLHRSYVM